MVTALLFFPFEILSLSLDPTIEMSSYLPLGVLIFMYGVLSEAF